MKCPLRVGLVEQKGHKTIKEEKKESLWASSQNNEEVGLPPASRPAGANQLPFPYLPYLS